MTAFDPTKRRNLPFPLAGANTADRSPVALPVAQGAPQAPEPENVLPRVPVEQPAAEPVMPLPEDSQAKPTLARANAPGQTQSLANRFPGGGKSANQQELERLQQSPSGARGIHNPILRTLATIGDIALGTFAPRAEVLTPGTQGHHNMLLDRAGDAVKGEQDAANQESEQTLRRAQTRHADAQATALENPQDKPASNDVELFQRDPKAFEQFQKLTTKPEKQTGTVHEGADGNLHIIHGDGTSTIVREVGGAPVGAPKKTPSPGSIYTDGEGSVWRIGDDNVAVPVMTGPSVPAAPSAEVAEQPPANALPGFDAGPAPTGTAPTTPTPTGPTQLKGKTPAEQSATPDIKEYEYLSKTPAFKAKYPTLLDYQKVLANLRTPVTNITTGGLTNPQSQRVNQIASQFDTEPNVKRFNLIQEAKTFVNSLGTGSQATSTADQGLIYAFAKAMDPESVVRESEYQTVQRYAQSLAETYGFNAKRVFGNTPFLTDEARRNMKATIAQKYDASKTSYDRTYNEYARKINTQAGVKNGAEYLIDYRTAQPEAAAGGGAQAMGGYQIGHKYGNLEYLGGDPNKRESWK